MAKMFSITHGLENMGALRTGGQGSVYKARRMGEIIVAVKLLPTPVQAENDEDKNYRAFRNEVEKLKKVNERPNPHVVKILNSGITESGSFPFIEMEFIEGPDLAELLKAPHEQVFTIAEIIKVADQLANALNHCHSYGIKHGDMKSNNVKCNSQTGNYMLLDFGLAVMSDEQRRSSLQHAGAVEFMAPEQSEGTLLPQSDVYSYGIILYELLAGTVPFPMKDNGHASRNSVMIAHLDASLPDMLELRRQHLPATWSKEKQDMEMQVPRWLVELILKCLEKDPARRFASGAELYQTIIHQKSGLTVKNDTESALILQSQNEQLQTAVLTQQEQTRRLEQQVQTLQQSLTQKEQELTLLKSSSKSSAQNNQAAYSAPAPKRAFPAWLSVLLVLIVIGAAVAYFVSRSSAPAQADAGTDTSRVQPVTHSQANSIVPPKRRHRTPVTTVPANVTDTSTASPALVTPAQTSTNGKVYTLATKYAYFHNSPDAASVRKANINIWNNARLKALNEQNGYIYVVYTNESGQISRGWLDKRDLKQVR